MKVRRFFYVSSPRSTRLHIQYGPHHSEGRTACGRNIIAHLWTWMRKRPRSTRVCTACKKSA